MNSQIEKSIATIGERFGNKHDPVLRWTPGEYDTLRIESRHTPCDDSEENVREFAHVYDFCTMAGDCSPETELTDAEWEGVLRYMVDES